MTVREVLEAFKRGYTDCFNLSDIHKADNHFYGVEYNGIFFNLNSKEECFSSKEEYLAPFKEWNPELTFKIKWF